MNRDSIQPYRLSEARENMLWEKATFVFDTSALLDLYYLPKSTRKTIYAEIFGKLSGRLWVPQHVEYEYLKNRETIILKPINEKYDPIKDKIQKFTVTAASDLSKRIDEIARETKTEDKHPFLDQAEIKAFKECADAFCEQAKSFREKLFKQIETAETEIKEVAKNDDVLETLEKSFSVGREFTFDEIIEITKEGKHRYEYRIPPGYGDYFNKEKEKKGTQIFGDLIIWKQILEFSREKQTPVVFITSDIKKDEDWCYLDKDATEVRILSPREELIKEIKDHSGVDFWMYNLPQFTYQAKKHLKSAIKETDIISISLLSHTKEQDENYLTLKCKKCGCILSYPESVLDLQFERTDRTPRSMGPENQYTAEEEFCCTCGNSIQVFFDIWEYPAGAYNCHHVTARGADVLESDILSPFDFAGQLWDNDEDAFYRCQECDGDNDGFGNFVDLHDKTVLTEEYINNNGKFKYLVSGRCHWCNTLHLKCPQCHAITSVGYYQSKAECNGGCGLTFLKQRNVNPDENEIAFKIIAPRPRNRRKV